MKIPLIGSGGREHALAGALVRSPRCSALFTAPGNPGTARLGTNVVLDVGDHAAVVAFCRTMGIGLVVVGPEAPLVAGLVDDLAAAGIRAFGPSRAAARHEGSKAFTKVLCDEAGVPTAAYARFTSAEAARAHVLEECLVGEEASFIALVDGETAVPFGSAQDHKRVGDGDTGPNTGGMGAYSPAPVVTPAVAEQVMAEIVRPSVAAMKARGTPFRGVLFAGLMITDEGPKLIEYNVRFGDPECEVLMPRLLTDLVALMEATIDGTLASLAPAWRDEAALTVVMAARGYPGKPETGTPIRGIAGAERLDGITVYHAGTREQPDGTLVAAGGRVLAVTALAPTIAQARDRAYEAVDRIDWPGGFCRRDIGWRAAG